MPLDQNLSELLKDYLINCEQSCRKITKYGSAPSFADRDVIKGDLIDLTYSLRQKLLDYYQEQEGITVEPTSLIIKPKPYQIFCINIVAGLQSEIECRSANTEDDFGAMILSVKRVSGLTGIDAQSVEEGVLLTHKEGLDIIINIDGVERVSKSIGSSLNVFKDVGEYMILDLINEIKFDSNDRFLSLAEECNKRIKKLASNNAVGEQKGMFFKFDGNASHEQDAVEKAEDSFKNTTVGMP